MSDFSKSIIDMQKAGEASSTLVAKLVTKVIELESSIPPLSRSDLTLLSEKAMLPSGAAQTVDLPGPDDGFVRVYNSLHTLADPIAALTGIVISLVSGGNLYTHQASTSLSSGAVINSAFGIFVFPGESIRWTNGGANTASVFGLYLDVPIEGITAIRQQISDTGTIIIPAAPSGFVNRLYQPGPLSSSSSPHAAGGARVWNADAVTHTFSLTQGGVRMGTIAATTVAAGAVNGYTSGAALPITDTPLIAVLGEAVNTTAPWILSAYETLPLA
jgi:hypothetical protein